MEKEAETMSIYMTAAYQASLQIAYEQGATKEGIYSLFDKIIKTGSKIAINISEKI